jgi:hypothetical protein
MSSSTSVSQQCRRVAQLRGMIATAKEQITRQSRDRRALSAWDLCEWERRLVTTTKDLDERTVSMSRRRPGGGIRIGTPVVGDTIRKTAAKDLLEVAKHSGALVQELEYLNERRQKVMDDLEVVRMKLIPDTREECDKTLGAVTRWRDAVTAAGTFNTVDTLWSVPLSELTDEQCEKLHRDRVMTNRGFGARDPNHPRNRFDRAKFEDGIRRDRDNHSRWCRELPKRSVLEQRSHHQ